MIANQAQPNTYLRQTVDIQSQVNDILEGRDEASAPARRQLRVSAAIVFTFLAITLFLVFLVTIFAHRLL
jgi:hypothetical protein